MRVYDADAEARVYTGKVVKDWTRSGLIEPSQATTLDPDLKTELRRTNVVLRLVLFFFAATVIQSVLGLAFLFLGAQSEAVLGVTGILVGAGFLALLEYLAGRARFYRFGVEEACAAAAVACLSAGTALLISGGSRFPSIELLVIVGALCLLAYSRYGFLYAALVSMGCAAAIPFVRELSWPVARGMSAAILMIAWVVARGFRKTSAEEIRRDEYGILEAAAWLGAYALTNAGLSWEFLGPELVGKAFFWGAYAASWILPMLGLFLGIRDRHRPMIWVNIVAALATLVSNRSYLGWSRNTWDPIVLGVFLAGTAIVIRRWLSAGPNGERDGFTPQRILRSDSASLAIVSTLAGAAQSAPTHGAGASASETFGAGGGSSGGGGATGKF